MAAAPGTSASWVTPEAVLTVKCVVRALGRPLNLAARPGDASAIGGSVMNLFLSEEACGSRRMAGCHGPRRARLHDASPARDVPGRDVVGGASEPAPPAGKHAPPAGKHAPAGTVGLVNLPALRALPRRVPRVHQNDRHRGEHRLAGGEPPKLRECPGVRVRALRRANRYPAADAGKILQLDPAPGAFGFAYAEQNERDYQALLDAVAAGRVQAVMGLSGANPRPLLTGPLLPRIPGRGRARGRRCTDGGALAPPSALSRAGVGHRRPTRRRAAAGARRRGG